MPIFNFSDEDALGKVASVDTANVIVDVENVDQLKRLQVNHLAVLQSSRPGQHLIGLITQVTRKRGIEDIADDGIGENTSELNLCKIALIGTMLDRDALAALGGGSQRHGLVVAPVGRLRASRVVGVHCRARGRSRAQREQGRAAGTGTG